LRSTPFSTTTVRCEGRPSSSKGEVPNPPTPVGSSIVLSSTIVRSGAAIVSPSFPARNDAPRQIASPDAASNTEPMSVRAVSGAKIIGTLCVATRRAPSRRNVRRAAS
jgi:hypothetical protein